MTSRHVTSRRPPRDDSEAVVKLLKKRLPSYLPIFLGLGVVARREYECECEHEERRGEERK